MLPHEPQKLSRFRLDLDQLDRHLSGLDKKTADRDRQREAAWTGAPRIDVDNTVLPSNSRPVGVAGDDSLESRRGRIEVEIVDVVEHMEQRALADLKYLRRRKRL